MFLCVTFGLAYDLNGYPVAAADPAECSMLIETGQAQPVEKLVEWYRERDKKEQKPAKIKPVLLIVR
jgi:hypothetical protein